MSTKSVPVLPPVDGTVNIPESLNFHWKHNAELPVFAFNRDGSDHINEITYLEFGRACHRVAHHIRPGRAGPDRQIVAVIAHCDTMLYQAITVGLITAGLVPFPISPRNTPAGVFHLLEKTSCHRLITTSVALRALIDGVKAEQAPDFELTIEEIPSLSQIYPNLAAETAQDPFVLYPPPTTRPLLSETAIIMHSSGSTGFPKAIYQTHLMLAHWSAFPCVLKLRSYTSPLRIAGMMLPTFHTLGLCIQVIFPLFGMASIGMYPPQVTSPDAMPVMITPANILDHIRRTRSNATMAIPALLQVWAQNPASVELLKTLQFVIYSGGAATPKLGDFLVKKGVKLYSLYGGTEIGSPTTVFPRPGDEQEWQYAEFSSRAKVRWAPQGDGTYECQFLTTETHSLSIENLPDVRGYATADLWERHPTKEYLWKIVGRIDDVIMHSSGEKTVPAPMEDIVMSSPYVMATVMFGRAHNQAGILVEPKPEHAIDVADQAQLAEFRNKLWPVMEEANSVAPAFSRIFKEMILITGREKPLPRAGKGTVMRKIALSVYEAEIEALYATVEQSAGSEDVVPPASWSADDVQSWLLEQAADIHPDTAFDTSADLFEQGFDSLSATILRRRLVGALRMSKDSENGAVPRLSAAAGIAQGTVYAYPTISALTAFLVRLVADPEGVQSIQDGKLQIEAMVGKYGAGLEAPISSEGTVPEGTERKVVLLTGSTGNLGAQILAALLGSCGVGRVYALNRPSKGKETMLERHRERFVDKALDVTLLADKRLVFVEGDTALPGLGVREEVYKEIRDTVTMIIHNAWRLDFNMSLSSFEPNVRGVRMLVDLARAGPHPQATRFLFMSSVASAQAWDRARGPFPEEVVEDASIAVGMGYGESKYAAERILAKSGLQVTSFRIGQITGGLPNGAWATSDWLPILVKSSVALGALPSASGMVSWLPMNAVAEAILDVAFTQGQQPPTALNLVHPRPVEWDSVMGTVREALEENVATSLGVLPFQEWFTRLEKRAKNASDADITAIPAIKLLDFLRPMATVAQAISQAGCKDAESSGMTKFSTVKVQSFSATMKKLPPIGAEDAKRWVRYWRGVRLFE